MLWLRLLRFTRELLVLMKYIKDKAIILSTRDYGEADLLVAFLTRHHGKVAGVAKHARKSKRRFVNSLGTFNLVEIEYGEKAFPSLVFVKKAVLAESFSMLRRDIVKLSCAGLVAEAIKEMVPERMVQPEVFDLLFGTLTEISISKDPVSTSCLSLWRLIVMAGLTPRLDLCLVCKKKISKNGIWYFDPVTGGTVCKDHIDNKKAASSLISFGIISLLEKARHVEIEKLWRFKFRPEDRDVVLKMLARYVEFHIEKPLKSMNVLSQIDHVI